MKNKYKILGLALLTSSVLLLGACNKSPNQPSASNDSTSNGSSASAGSSVSPSPGSAANTGANPAAPTNQVPTALAQDPSLRITQTPTGERIVQSAPAVAPPEYYSPSAVEVQGALADVLVATVGKMPNSPERNKFYQDQANLLQTLRVGECSKAPAGQPVACNIAMGSYQAQIKLLLTQSGWVIVK